MDNFLTKSFQKLPEIHIPDGLHNSIMRSVTIRQYKNHLLISTTFVSLNFIFSLYHTYTAMFEADGLSIIQAVTSTFDPSIDSLTDSLQTLLRFLPIQAILFSIVNLTILFFMIKLLGNTPKLSPKFQM